MTQLEQLTAIISQARRDMRGVFASSHEVDRAIAERLLEKGVILPPCKEFCGKLGDYIYIIDGGEVLEVMLFSVGFDCNGEDSILAAYNAGYEDSEEFNFRFADIGKTVFLTREEAEKALKEGASA